MTISVTLLLCGIPVPPGGVIFVPAVVFVLPPFIRAIVMSHARKKGTQAPAKSSPVEVVAIIFALIFFAISVAGGSVLQRDPQIGLGQPQTINVHYFITGKGHPRPLRVSKATYDKARRYGDVTVAGITGAFASIAVAIVGVQRTDRTPIPTTPTAPKPLPVPIPVASRQLGPEAETDEDALRRRIAERDGQSK